MFKEAADLAALLGEYETAVKYYEDVCLPLCFVTEPGRTDPVCIQCYILHRSRTTVYRVHLPITPCESTFSKPHCATCVRYAALLAASNSLDSHLIYSLQDLVGARRALDEYRMKDPSFEQQREYKFLVQLVQAVEDRDEETL
jgi:hypothetical protein